PRLVARLLSVRALLRVNNPRSVISGNPGARTVLSAATHAEQETAESPQARANAPWLVARLLPVRALLRVNNPRSVISGNPGARTVLSAATHAEQEVAEGPQAHANVPWLVARLLPVR